MKTPSLNNLLGIDYPIIMAPMFLISTTEMIKIALKSGITAAFPALNYRTDKELRHAIREIKAYSDKPFGVNLIVNKSNTKRVEQLNTLLDMKVDYIITSLGNPSEVISRCHQQGIDVFCDVISLEHALKAEKAGADGLIAVNDQAGGHAGNMHPKLLIELLKTHCNIPLISAGGIAAGKDIHQAMHWGAQGVSVGTLFIACVETTIAPEYKRAIVHYGEKDIIQTTKISGTPLTVINTPYVQAMHKHPTWLAYLPKKNKRIKRYVNMITSWLGAKKIEKAALGATYKTVWCAGPVIEHVHAIYPLQHIINTLINEFKEASDHQ